MIRSRTVTQFAAVCDVCKEHHPGWYGMLVDVVDNAKWDGWKISDTFPLGIHICPKIDKPHNDARKTVSPA